MQQPTMSSATAVPYAFHTSSHVSQQLQHLQTCLDPFTVGQLEQVGVDAGWSCLEIGAGGGSVAAWLAARVGPSGQVLATDLETARINPAAGLRVLCHDIDIDPVPAPGDELGWDLIHARLVLQHLPRRRQIVARLAAALAPGGWLLLEDFDCRHLPVAAAPEPLGADLFSDVTAAILAVLEGAGADLAWGVDTYHAMRQAGLVDVAAHAQTRTWTGGSAGCLLHATNTHQLADRLHQRGLDEPTLERFRALMANPDFAAPFYLLVSTRGRRSG